MFVLEVARPQLTLDASNTHGVLLSSCHPLYSARVNRYSSESTGTRPSFYSPVLLVLDLS